jgi:WD40 repeat protein
MRKTKITRLFLFCLTALLCFSVVFTNIFSMEEKVVIKKEILMKDKSGKPIVQCWSRPKPPDNKPWFFKGLENITNLLIKNPKDLPFGNSVAFLIGVSDYKYLSPQLPFVKKDLEELANTLLTVNGFDSVYMALNEAVTPAFIRDFMLNRFRKELNENDRLLFYYSGHGADIGGKTGYMLLLNFKSTSDCDYNNDVLEITACENWSRLIKIKHILFIYDCCASGLGFTPKGNSIQQPICLSLSGNGSRAVITAGTGEERVYGDEEHSIFTKALISSLKKEESYKGNNGFLTVGEIFDQIKREVGGQSKVKQTPNMWEFEEDKYRGNFIFINTNLQDVKLSSKDLKDLPFTSKGGGETENIGAVGIIQLTSYLSGTVFIDDVEVNNIEKGDVKKYYDQPVGLHTIKVINDNTSAVGTVNVIKGEIASIRITEPVVENKIYKNTSPIPTPVVELKDSSKKSSVEVFVQLGHSDRVTSVAISPDGKYALSGSWDKTLKLWEISSGRKIRSFTGHSDNITSVAFSPDGKYALSGSWDKTLKLWEISSGMELKSFTGHSDNVTSVTFSPDGKYALSGSWDKTLKLWEISSGKEIRNFTGHSDRVTSVAISPDGKYVLSGSWDKTLKLWEIVSGMELKSFTEHSNVVNSVAISSDGKYALAGSADKTLKIWKISSGYKIKSFTESDYVTSVAFSPDGKYALSGNVDNTLKLWEISSGKEIKSFTGHSFWVDSVAFSPDGKYALSGSYDTTTRIWNIATGKEIAQFVSFDDGEWVVLTPEGYYNASPKGAQYLNVRIDNKDYSIDDYAATFYRPDLVQAALGDGR